MFVSYGQMDGTAINWEAYGSWSYINLAIWILLILAPVLIGIFCRNKKGFSSVIKGISLGIIGVQCITLLTVGLTNDISKDQDYYVARDDQMLNLSKEKNIVVMLFDAYQASYFRQTIEDIPEADQILENFVFFENAAGTSRWSEEGSATILTGHQLLAELPFRENIDYIYNQSQFLPLLKKNHYDVRYYVQSNLVSPTLDGVIQNIVKREQEIAPSFSFSKVMLQITAFRYMPHVLKPYFWFSYNDIENLKAVDTKDEKETEFIMADQKFNQEILDGELASENKNKTYRFYYFKGVHTPYNMNADCEYVEYDGDINIVDYVKDIHENDMIYQQSLGCIRIIANFIQALKDEGIYDQTDIVITADHGWENRYNPLLLVKSKDTAGPFKISRAPVSYIEDFEPTILSLIDESYQEKKTVFDYEEGEERRRYFYVYDINIADRSYNERVKYYTDTLNPPRISDFQPC